VGLRLHAFDHGDRDDDVVLMGARLVERHQTGRSVVRAHLAEVGQIGGENPEADTDRGTEVVQASLVDDDRAIRIATRLCGGGCRG
jgi:hypothetical protein